MDNPNITMEEYIRLEEEKAQRHRQTFNWQTAMFGKVVNYEDEDECSIDFETEFPAIVFDNTITSEPTVCPPNENELDFRISLDESDDEDYMVIFYENSFSYKIISVNDLKMDSGNDKPLSPNPTVDYFDDLDYFNDFKNEFPAIVYNDGLTSKSDLEIKPLVSSERINEFNLIDKTSLSEYDEEIVSHFNDLFNDIYPDDLKLKKDNDDNDIDIIQSSEGDEITHGENGLSETIHDKIIKTFETGRSGSEVEDGIFWRRAASIHESCLEETVWDPSTFGGVRRRMTWRQFILALGLHTEQEMAEAGFGAYWDGRDRHLIGKPVLIFFYLRSMNRGPTNVLHLLAQYLFRHAEGRKSRARLSGGHFIGRLAMHFGLVSDEGLRGLSETWTWVALGPERKQGVPAGAHEADKAGQATKEVAPEIPAPAQAPSPPPPALQPCTISQRIERVEEEVHHLRCDVTGLRGVVESFTTEQSKVSPWLISCMTQLMDASGQTYQPFDSTLVGSS
ncbi:hypothetical protein Tco_1344770 [Tanacetum coccineum]